MRRFVACAAPLLLLLAACGSSDDGGGGGGGGGGDDKGQARPSASDSPSSDRPARSPSASPSASTPSPTRTAGPTTSDPEDCFDGDCRLKLSAPTTIRLDAEKFHYPEMRVVRVGPDSLTYRVDYPGGGGAEQNLSPGGGSAFSFRSQTPVEVTLESITDGKAVLALSPGTPE
jgi:hypothetical protein